MHWAATASHSSAAFLWGMFRYPPEAIEVTAPTRRRAKREFKVHFSSCLTEEDRSIREDIPVTSVARTALDLAISSRPSLLERCLERAEQLGVFDLIEFEDLLARAGGHRGRRRLRSVLGIYEPQPAFTRSRLERRFLEMVRKAGLPAP